MILSRSRSLLGLVLAAVLFGAAPLRAEYLRIELRVYGLDCELCARGVSATIERMAGVKSVDVSLKKGMLDIALVPGNSFKMSDLRKRIRENGFRSMEATVTAIGVHGASGFEVLGSGESYKVGEVTPKDAGPVEFTFDVH